MECSYEHQFHYCLFDIGEGPTITSINYTKVNEGQPTTVLCRASGFPAPTISLRVGQGTSMTPQSSNQTSRSTVSVFQTNLTNNAQLECSASNNEGSASDRVTGQSFSK